MGCFSDMKAKGSEGDTFQAIDDYGNLPLSKSKCHPKPWLVGGAVALVMIAAAGAVAAAYFLNPSFHTLLNHTFSHIQNGQMSVAQGLLYIALPLGGVALIVGFSSHFYRKHRQRKQGVLQLWGREGALKAIGQTCKTFKPTGKQLLIAGVVLLALAALVVGGHFFFQHMTIANQWMHSHLFPVLQHKIQIWQALAYMGGGTAAAALLTGLVIRLLQITAQRIADRPLWKNLNIPTDT